MRISGVAWVMMATGFSMAAFAMAQEPEPVFRTTTRLVEISVAVKGPANEPPGRLTKDDFKVTAGGKPRPVAFVQFEGAVQREAPLAPLPRYIFTNRPEYQTEGRPNVVAIVLDTLNSTREDGLRMRGDVSALLTRIPPGSRVALYHLGSRLRVLHDFTEDPQALMRRVAELKAVRRPGAEDDLAASQRENQDLLDVLGERAGTFQQALDASLQAEIYQASRMQADRYEMAYASMAALARHLAAAPGRKALIWAGGGLPAVQIVGYWTFGSHNSKVPYLDRIRSAARQLSEANVALYYHDSRGLVAPASPMSLRLGDPVLDGQRITGDARIGTRVLAESTGGRYFWADNRLTTALEAAIEDQRNQYTVAFYATEDDTAPWTEVQVKVNRRGYSTAHREGFGAPAPAEVWDDETVKSRMTAPLGWHSVLLNARCEPFLSPAGRTLRLFVQVDAETLTFVDSRGERGGSIEVAVAELDAQGRTMIHRETARLRVRPEHWARTLQEGIPYRREWAPHPSSVRLRVLVRDNASARIGTLEIPLGAVLGEEHAAPAERRER